MARGAAERIEALIEMAKDADTSPSAEARIKALGPIKPREVIAEAWQLDEMISQWEKSRDR